MDPWLLDLSQSSDLALTPHPPPPAGAAALAMTDASWEYGLDGVPSLRGMLELVLFFLYIKAKFISETHLKPVI